MLQDAGLEGAGGVFGRNAEGIYVKGDKAMDLECVGGLSGSVRGILAGDLLRERFDKADAV
jgi:hypothetical protein